MVSGFSFCLEISFGANLVRKEIKVKVRFIVQFMC